MNNNNRQLSQNSRRPTYLLKAAANAGASGNREYQNYQTGVPNHRNQQIDNVPSGQNTGQFGAGSAIMSHARGSTSNPANNAGGTYIQNQNLTVNGPGYGQNVKAMSRTNMPLQQNNRVQQQEARKPNQATSLGPRSVAQPQASHPAYMNKIGNARTGGRQLPHNIPKGAQQQKPQSRTLRNDKPQPLQATSQERQRPEHVLQNNYFPGNYATIDPNIAHLEQNMLGQYATAEPRPIQPRQRNAPDNFDAVLQASDAVRSIPITRSSAMELANSSSQGRLDPYKMDSQGSQEYNTEALKYPLNQQKVLLAHQAGPNAVGLQQPNNFKRTNQNTYGPEYHQSSNPRFDLPRQAAQKVYEHEQSPPNFKQAASGGNVDFELQKQLLAQYYEQKFQKEREAQREHQFPTKTNELERLIEYAQQFAGQQAAQQQQYQMQQPTFQKPMTQLPVQQLRQQKMQALEKLQGQTPKSADSSGGSDKDLEAMITAMKQDVQECKQWLFQDKKSLRSDEGASPKKMSQPASANRGKSAESKSSETLARDHSYKRPKKEQASSSLGRAPARERNAQQSKSSKNSKGQSNSGTKQARAPQQLLPERIFSQDRDAEQQEAPIDLRNRKQISPEAKQIHKNLNSLTQFSEQTFNENKERPVHEEIKVNERPVIREEEEQAKGRKGTRKMERRQKDREDLKVNTAEPPNRNGTGLVNLAEQEEFNDLNIAGNLSGSDDENQQRIFQFSPLSSKKQADDDDSENGEDSSGGRQNYTDNDNLIGGEIKSESLGPPSSAAYSRMEFQDTIDNQEADSVQNQSVSYGEERNVRSRDERQLHSQAESTGRFLNPMQRGNSGMGAPSSADDTFNSQRHIQEQTQQHQGSVQQSHQTTSQQNLIQAQPLRKQLAQPSSNQHTSQRAVEQTHEQNQDTQIMNGQIPQRLADTQLTTTDRFAALNGTTLTVEHRDQTYIIQPPLTSHHCQTDAPPELQSQEIQTEKEAQPVRNLSPFETYDLLFIRDLVNNLNYDNEVLHDNASDLKAAFMFLYNEHKQLQFQYQKEKRNEALASLYRERADELTQERDSAITAGMKLRAKLEMMNDVMQLAVSESQMQQKEDEQLIEQLAQENQELRKILGVNRKINKAKGEKAIKGPSSPNDDGKDSSSSNDGDDLVDTEIEEQLITAEQELQRTQDDYLLMLREEQDLQFSREIDEHKEIIQRIYDDKLVEKTEEIEVELQETLTRQLTETLRADLTEEIENRVADEIRQSLAEEVRDDVTREVTQEVTERVTDAITAEITQSLTQKLTMELSQKIEEELREKYDKIFQDHMQASFGSNEASGNEGSTPEEQVGSRKQQMIQEEENRRTMASLKLQNQRSLEGENDQTTQDLEALLRYESGNNERNSRSSSSSAYQDEFEDDRYDETERFSLPSQAVVDENAQTSKLFASEKARFKAELMAQHGKSTLSSTLPPSRQPLQIEEVRRSREQSSGKSGSGASGQSDDWNSGDDQNQYDFEQIFDDQALSKEEEELFNQLKAREEQQNEGQTFDLTQNKERADREEEKREMEDDGELDETLKYNNHLGQDQNSQSNNDTPGHMPTAFRLRNSDRNSDLKLIAKQNKNERYYQNHLNNSDEYGQLEEQKDEIKNRQDDQDRDFQRDPNDAVFQNNWRNQVESNAQQDDIQEPVGFSSAERIVESDNQDEEQINPIRPSRNQFQGFQGQAVKRHNLAYQGSSLNDQVSDGGQGQSRGGQRQHNINIITSQGQDIAGEQINSSSQQQVQDDSNSLNTQHSRGQGFQGQVKGQGLYDFSKLDDFSHQRNNQPQTSSLVEESKGEEAQILQKSSSEDSIGSFENDDQEVQNIQQPEGKNDGSDNIYVDEAYEYDDFFNGLQNEMMHQSSNIGVQKEGQSQIQPNSSQDDLFGYQLDGDGMLDSTKGMRNMIKAMKQGEQHDSQEQAQQIQDLLEDEDISSPQEGVNSDDEFIEDFEEMAAERDPDNEEVYDYFLDQHKDENQNENAGYHIIDQEDLEGSGAKQGQDGDQQLDEDDLDQIQDEELKQYRYNNMLEDLKDKIAEEEDQ